MRRQLAAALGYEPLAPQHQHGHRDALPAAPALEDAELRALLELPDPLLAAPLRRALMLLVETLE